MVKSKLISFIGKYNLGGNIDSVRLVVKNNVLTTTILSPERSIHGTIRLNDFKFPDSELAVYETSKLKKILNCVGEEITLEPIVEDGKTVSIKISDKDDNANFALSELEVIPEVPNLRNIPVFNLEIPLTKDFISKFINDTNNLSEAENFTVIQEKGNTKIVLGHSPSQNTNSVSIKVIPNAGKDTIADKISFSARYLKEIFQANPEVVDSTLFISDKGMANVTVGTDKTDFFAKYYLTKVSVI